jgi:hypothetical protein
MAYTHDVAHHLKRQIGIAMIYAGFASNPDSDPSTRTRHRERAIWLCEAVSRRVSMPSLPPEQAVALTDDLDALVLAICGSRPEGG